MKIESCNSYYVRIYMAGDVSVAKNVCREFCLVGLCINIYATDYIYTLGEETGFCVELINYPRFPKNPDEILSTGQSLADLLMHRLFQASYTIVTPEISYMYSRKDEFTK